MITINARLRWTSSSLARMVLTIWKAQTILIAPAAALSFRLPIGPTLPATSAGKLQSGFDAWWNDSVRVKDPQGYFREILTVPTNRFETISTYNTQVGVARTGCPVVGPIREHNYWGSMRDRLQVSADDLLLSAHGEQLPRLGAAATLGRRLRVNVPENLAIIRSGQDWTDCAGAELTEYNDSVRPALIEGMNFLRDHPDETGCCDLRFAEESARDGAR